MVPLNPDMPKYINRILNCYGHLWFQDRISIKKTVSNKSGGGGSFGGPKNKEADSKSPSKVEYPEVVWKFDF